MFSLNLPATTQPAAPSLFGGTPAAAPAPAAPSFGLQPTAATPAAGGSLFGQSTAAPTPAGSFGQPAPAAPAGGGLFGQPAASTQQQQQQPPAAITKTTRYGELTDQQRQYLDSLEAHMQKQRDLVEEIQANRSVDEIRDIHTLCDSVTLKCFGLKNLLDRDNNLIQNLRGLMATEMKNADSATRFIDRYKNNTQSLHSSSRTADSSLKYDLERHFQLLSQRSLSPQAIADILRNQYESFMSIAGKIATVHDAITNERERFLLYRSKYFGEGRNPFKDSSVDTGMTPLGVVATDLMPTPAQQQAQGAAPAAGATGKFGGFGTSGTATTGFGTSGTTTTGFGTGGTTTGFGAGATTGGFGASTGFGAAAPATTGFGAAAPATTGFGGNLFGKK
ncbi:Nucleoporin p58/p45 [Irineochytrium annulatum]|nr:Nucleoporin p58/p45 [Irineochytrium annulatum]